MDALKAVSSTSYLNRRSRSLEGRITERLEWGADTRQQEDG